MDYMIYIYLGLAFVLAGGGWFIGFHGGYRRGYRDKQRESERMAHKMMLNAQFGKGLVYDVNSLYPAEIRVGVPALTVPADVYTRLETVVSVEVGSDFDCQECGLHTRDLAIALSVLKQPASLADQIHTHLEIMDADE